MLDPDIETESKSSSSIRDRAYWQDKNSYYHNDQKRYFRFLIPEGVRTLEIGCGLGDLLAAVKPAYGVGIDIDGKTIESARLRHPNLTFIKADVENLDLLETFDAVIISDTIGDLCDIQQALQSLHKCCHQRTRIFISYYSFLWEPILNLAEKLGMKRPQKKQNWLALNDIENLVSLAGFDKVKTESRLLIPKYIPILSTLFNKYLFTLPLIRKLCLCNYLVARPLLEKPHKSYSTTIVIPCRNERGHIHDAIKRLPNFGLHQEIIYIDGHSTDGTPDEIKDVIKKNPNKDIKFMVQDGKGKGDAIRKAFSAANGDILMILDADLTVPPEDLNKFYNAIASNKGEFINGSRLVYPMENQAMRFLNILGNKFFAMAFSWLLNQRLKDTLCGTKVIFREDYKRLADARSYFGEFDPFGDFDLIFGASKLNLRIVELPIRYRERVYGETNISRFTHGWLLLKMTVFAFLKLKAI